jgi:protein SCO1/2
VRKILPFLLLAVLAWPAAAAPLAPGDPVPAFSLRDAHGRTVSLKDFRGKLVLINFIYTQCPVPTMCPMVTDKLVRTRQLIDKIEGGKERFVVLSVTIDPERDNAQRLKSYAAVKEAQVPNWFFLTGKLDTIRLVASWFGVTFWKEDSGLVVHNLAMGLIGPDGRLLEIVSGGDWKPGELAAKIKGLLEK